MWGRRGREGSVELTQGERECPQMEPPSPPSQMTFPSSFSQYDCEGKHSCSSCSALTRSTIHHPPCIHPACSSQLQPRPYWPSGLIFTQDSCSLYRNSPLQALHSFWSMWLGLVSNSYFINWLNIRIELYIIYSSNMPYFVY